MGGTVICTS